MANKQGEGQEFFMRIENPKTFRRNLLESSKLTLGVLKQTYSVKQLREMKEEIMGMIDKEIKELKLLVQRLDEMVPKHSEQEIRRRFPEINFRKQLLKANLPPKVMEKPELKVVPVKPAPAEVKPKPKPKPKPLKKVSEVDKLTRALDDVMYKLKNL